MILSEKKSSSASSYACADEDYRLNIRVINEYPWSNMFAHNMFLRPHADELKDFTTRMRMVINAL